MSTNFRGWMSAAIIMMLSPGVFGSDDVAPATEAGTGEGGSLFEERCAVCHDSGIPGIPPREKLASLSPDYIINALKDGLMFEQAYGLSDEQIGEIANYVANPSD